ncbi:MAG: hypothetical protein AcusKO_43030 [Acuticoccus sp.]
MLTETLINDIHVVGIACKGQLTKDELNRMHALIHDRLATIENPGLVLDLSEFEGYATAAALLEDLKIDIDHRNDFGRIAIVGDERWMERGVAIASLLTRAEMRWFEVGERDDAVDWARRG